MHNLSQQDQKQIQDLSSQLQSGLQQFLYPGQKSGILTIQYGHAAAAAEISFWVGINGQCHKRYCFVTLTFNFKVTGGLLKVRFWPFFHIWAQFLYTES